MKAILLTAMLILATVQMKAQTNDEITSQLAGSGISQIVGLSYSTVSGAGLTYQHLFNPNYRVKVAGLLFWDESTKDMNKDILAYNAGGEFHRAMHQTNITRLYALVGGQYDYKRSSGGYLNEIPGIDNADTEKQIAKTISFGVGVGLEVFTWKNVAINAEGNYYFFQTIEENTTPDPVKSGVFNYREDLIRGVRFGFGLGIGYAF